MSYQSTVQYIATSARKHPAKYISRDCLCEADAHHALLIFEVQQTNAIKPSQETPALKYSNLTQIPTSLFTALPTLLISPMVCNHQGISCCMDQMDDRPVHMISLTPAFLQCVFVYDWMHFRQIALIHGAGSA